MAEELGFSLGKLNYCLKAMKNRGFIYILKVYPNSIRNPNDTENPKKFGIKNLFGIRNPSSQGTPVSDSEFQLINNFEEIRYLSP